MTLPWEYQQTSLKRQNKVNTKATVTITTEEKVTILEWNVSNEQNSLRFLGMIFFNLWVMFLSVASNIYWYYF